jgi:hypothetical protein
MGKVLLALVSTLFLVTQVMAGAWTPNNFLYKPATGARSDDEIARFDSGLDRVDSRLANEKWLNDPPYSGDLGTAIAAIGSAKTVLSIPAGNWPITANLTVPANLTLKFTHGALLTIATGKTLTINGPLCDASPYQIFSCTGTGKVLFGAGAVKEIYPEWWATNTTPGATNMTAAIRAAANSILAPGGVVRFSSTLYLISDEVAVTSSGVVTFAGNGYACTAIYQTADHDFINFTSSAGSGRLIVKDLAMYSTLAMTSGAAIRCIGGGVTLDKSLTVDNVLIQSSNNTLGYEFRYGIYADACTASAINNSQIAGSAMGTTHMVGLYITDTSGVSVASHVYNLNVCNAAYAVKIACDKVPGVEGWYFTACDFITEIGLYAVATTNSAGYFPPQIVLSHSHINSLKSVYISGFMHILIDHNLFYNRGTDVMIELVNTPQVCVDHNYFHNDTGGNAGGLKIICSGGGIAGSVDHNNFSGLTASYPAMKLVASGSGAFYYLDIARNIATVGATTLDTSSAGSLQVVYVDNVTKDTGDKYALMAVDPKGHYLNIDSNRSNYIICPTSAADVTGGLVTIQQYSAAAGKWPRITIVFTNASPVTVVHSTGANGIYLKGAANHTPVQNEVMEFVYDPVSAYWREVSRYN